VSVPLPYLDSHHAWAGVDGCVHRAGTGRARANMLPADHLKAWHRHFSSYGVSRTVVSAHSPCAIGMPNGVRGGRGLGSYFPCVAAAFACTRDMPAAATAPAAMACRHRTHPRPADPVASGHTRHGLPPPDAGLPCHALSEGAFASAFVITRSASHTCGVIPSFLPTPPPYASLHLLHAGTQCTAFRHDDGQLHGLAGALSMEGIARIFHRVISMAWHS